MPERHQDIRNTVRSTLLQLGPTARAFGEIRYQRMQRRGLSPELSAALDLLSPGDTVIDVGAAKGGYAYAFARAVGASGLVIACEPNPSSFHQLEQSTWQTAVDARQLGIGSEAGELALHVPQGSGAGVDEGLGTFTGSFSADDLTVTVHVSTIDEIAKSLSALRLIKIDVEGWELEALRGASDTVERLRPHLVVECERRHLQKIGEHEDAFFDWAKKHRYKVTTIGQDDLPASAAFDAQDAFNSIDATSFHSGTYPNNFLLTPER